MPLSSIAMKSGVTSYTVNGGTAETLFVKGQKNNSVSLGSQSDTAQLTAKTITFTNVDSRPSVSGPNGATQSRRTINLTQPKTLTNGKTTKNGISVTLHVDPETTDTEITALLDRLITTLVDSNISYFFKRGSLT